MPVPTRQPPVPRTGPAPRPGRLTRLQPCAVGATAIEYAIVAAGIAMAVVGVLTGLGTTVQGLFQSVVTSLP